MPIIQIQVRLKSSCMLRNEERLRNKRKRSNPNTFCLFRYILEFRQTTSPRHLDDKENQMNEAPRGTLQLHHRTSTALVNDVKARSKRRSITSRPPWRNSAHFWGTGRTPNLAKNPQVVTLDSGWCWQSAFGSRFLPRAAQVTSYR